MLTVPEPPPPPPPLTIAVMTPLLIVIVVPSTFTPPKTDVLATGIIDDITPLLITIDELSTFTAPDTELEAVGKRELSSIPVKLDESISPLIVVAFKIPLTVKVPDKLFHNNP